MSSSVPQGNLGLLCACIHEQTHRHFIPKRIHDYNLLESGRLGSRVSDDSKLNVHYYLGLSCGSGYNQHIHAQRLWPQDYLDCRPDFNCHLPGSRRCFRLSWDGYRFVLLHPPVCLLLDSDSGGSNLDLPGRSDCRQGDWLLLARTLVLGCYSCCYDLGNYRGNRVIGNIVAVWSWKSMLANFRHRVHEGN